MLGAESIPATADARALVREAWESDQWTSGLVSPCSELVRLTPARTEGDVRKLQVKITAAAATSKYICLGGADANIQCFDLAGRLVHTLASHGGVRNLTSCEQRQQSWLASLGAGGTLQLWTVDDGASLASSRHGKTTLMFSLNSAPATLRFFAPSAQPAPRLLLSTNGAPVEVTWRPEGAPVESPQLHDLCIAGAASRDEPHTAFAACLPGVCRIDTRARPTVAHPACMWRAGPQLSLNDTLWLRADSQYIVGAGKDRLHVWDVRRTGAPLCSISTRHPDGFEGVALRDFKGIELASRGRLVTTTYYTISGNQGMVALWDLGNLEPGAPQPVAQKLRLPRPAHTRSLLMTAFVGRQTLVALTPSSEVFTWRVGATRVVHT